MSRYREVGMLAEGGMAVIAQAERDDGCIVVIKRVRPPFCFDQSFLRLFSDEGAVHAALDHENIVRLLDRGEDEAGPFLVFEHVDGTDLAVVLEAEKRALDVECVLAVAIPMMKGLEAAHTAKDTAGLPLEVVHRDVSPGNVLIGQDGCVKLADFGVASFALKSEATVAGEMKGKFAYMAPEQTRGEKVGPRADIFSAGIVLFEALSGRRLFDGPTDADVVAAVRNAGAPSLDELRPGLPPALVALVAAMLDKDPEKRPARARDVVTQLQAIALELGLEDGLSRHAARLARLAPRRSLQVREMDARRRTQRVLDGTAVTGVVVRRTVPQRSRAPMVAAGAAVLLVAAVAVAMHEPKSDVVVTQLPATDVAGSGGRAPATPPTTPSTSTPSTSTPSTSTPSTSTPSTSTPSTSTPTPSTTPSKATPPTTPSTAPATRPGTDVAAAPSKPAHGDDDRVPVATAPSKPAHADVAAALPSKPAHAEVAAAPPSKPADAQGFGKLTITAEPWASVTIDGKLAVKETPLRAFTLPAGKHVVELANPTYGKKTVEITVPVDGDIKRYIDITAPQ